MAIDAKKWPELKKAWDDYGHEIPFEKLHAAKSDGRCGYVVVCWKTPDGQLALADLARNNAGGPWEMQNDGMSPDITEAEWRKLKVVPECDWFVIPGHADYKGM